MIEAANILVGQGDSLNEISIQCWKSISGITCSHVHTIPESMSNNLAIMLKNLMNQRLIEYR